MKDPFNEEHEIVKTLRKVVRTLYDIFLSCPFSYMYVISFFFSHVEHNLLLIYQMVQITSCQAITI